MDTKNNKQIVIGGIGRASPYTAIAAMLMDSLMRGQKYLKKNVKKIRAEMNERRENEYFI